MDMHIYYAYIWYQSQSLPISAVISSMMLFLRSHRGISERSLISHAMWYILLYFFMHLPSAFSPIIFNPLSKNKRMSRLSLPPPYVYVCSVILLFNLPSVTSSRDSIQQPPVQTQDTHSPLRLTPKALQGLGCLVEAV